MKLLLLFVASIALSVATVAQPSVDTQKEIQKLLNKANGKKYMGLFDESKIEAQSFTSAAISITAKGMGKYGSTWVTELKDINWSGGFEYYIWDAKGNSKLSMLTFKLAKDATSLHYVEGKTDDDPDKYNSIELYFLSSDREKMEAILKNATR